MTSPTLRSVPFRRRDFLEVGSTALLGLNMADVLQVRARGGAMSPQRPARNCIFVWLAGGPATIDMWDLKPNAPSQIRGEFAPIASALRGLSICEFLPELAKVVNHCVLVRSVTHTLADHAPGTELVVTGHSPTAALAYPSVGSVASKLLAPKPGVPSYIALGENAPGGSGFLGSSASPLRVLPTDLKPGRRLEAPVSLPDGFTVNDLARRNALRRALDRQFAAWDGTSHARELSAFEGQALDILRADKTRRAFDLAAEPETVRIRFGNGWPGQALLAARRLVEAGVGFVTVSVSGWDTHANNFARLRLELLPQLDRALAALISDLHRSGMLKETLIYCAGEFGRTPYVNSQGGRDHWPRAMSVLLAGAGLPRGLIYGSTDEQGMEPDTCRCTPADINATLLSHLGVPNDASLTTPAGRPIRAFGEGTPIPALRG
jgi:hypothetical protein